ncbi:MAG TPA: CPBP family intramembrane glutamic endopeptidase [Nitrospiria bacterium]
MARGGSLSDEGPRQERWALLALLPMVLTVGFSVLSFSSGASIVVTLIPQLSAYVCLAVWIRASDHWAERLFLTPVHFLKNAGFGFLTGLFTGGLNLWIILQVAPGFGYAYDFLRETPHARAPFFIMMPWVILAIAVFVELNFRGFLLGRLLVLFAGRPCGRTLAVTLSALVFSFDPFMISVFRGFHWLALTDGLIWGVLLLRTRSLYSVISAHAVEVMIVYTVLKIFYE